ncbi:MAG: glycosyltransferase family 1 protein [Burkholderiaceae bacterium]
MRNVHDIAATRAAPPARRRIAVDFHVVDGKYQGSRTYLIDLIGRAARRMPDVDFLLFSPNPAACAALGDDYRLPNVSAIRMPGTSSAARLLWQLPRLVRRHRVDLLHMQYVLPFAVACPCVVTIHDVLFRSHPACFPPLHRTQLRYLVGHATRRARRILTVSDYSRRSLREFYGVDAHRIGVTPNAVDRHRFTPVAADPRVDEAVLARHGLRAGDYYVSVGRLEPRKNYPVLLAALRRLGPDAPRLAIVGQRDFGYRRLFADAAALASAGKVVFLESVGDDELPILYRHAIGLAYPSRAEGFGMPLLEAMACGIPVIASDTTAIAEIVADAGIRVDPDDAGAWARQMRRLRDDRRLAATLVDAGLRRLDGYSWEASAEVLAGCYREALRES